MDTERDPPAPTTGDHQDSDLNVRVVAVLLLGLGVLTLIVQGALWFQLKGMWDRRQAQMPPPSPLAEALPTEPPDPRLQTSPQEDLKALRAAEDAQLHAYGWIDRKAGVVHIPIERAMEVIASEGGR